MILVYGWHNDHHLGWDILLLPVGVLLVTAALRVVVGGKR